jgi:hypothetical protein
MNAKNAVAMVFVSTIVSTIASLVLVARAGEKTAPQASAREATTPSTPVPTNTLAIYLIAGKRKPILGDNKLEPKPILADDDFAWFNTKNHQFAIKVEAAKRLGRRLNEGLPGGGGPWRGANGVLLYDVEGRDTPFVLTALGERIYEGIFSSDYSSISYRSLPVAKTWQVHIAADFTNDVVFDIGFNGSLAPWDFKSVPDPRSDERIVAAVAKLFPVTNRPPEKTPK